MKLSFVRRYSDWRSKHESSVGTEDIERIARVGRNGGRQDGERPARAARVMVEGGRQTSAPSPILHASDTPERLT